MGCSRVEAPKASAPVHCASTPSGLQIPAPGRCAWTHQPPGKSGVDLPSPEHPFWVQGGLPQGLEAAVWSAGPWGGTCQYSENTPCLDSRPGASWAVEKQKTNDKSQQLAAWLGVNGSPWGLQKAIPLAQGFSLEFHWKLLFLKKQKKPTKKSKLKLRFTTSQFHLHPLQQDTR